ncbi:MAG TPA: alpha/beta hydrolase [Thermoguttaceae bacterium]|nr:alpha/beta hydrolase [Thermoguttaceae bacterium]
MKVLFLHGFGSDPNGIRPTTLREHGFAVIHPALPDDDYAESVRIAQQAFDQSRPDVVVGSSRGGAVALGIETGQTPLVLIAPAWKHWESDATIDSTTQILHSRHDDVVAIEDSQELLRRSRLPIAQLVVVGECHKMTDKAAFEALFDAVERAVEN